MITVNNLTKKFADKVIINNITFETKAKGITVVLGKNGSGKSVLLKCIAALLPFEGGSIQISGENVSKDMYYKRIGDKTHSAYVFQRGGLFDSMTVFDNVAFGMRRRDIGEDSILEKVTLSLKSVGLTGAENKLPSELSGGMQKRVGLARALCMNPRVILYDDPTAGLDPILTDSIADLVLDIRDKDSVTSIVVTHDLKFAEKIADSVILLYGGMTVFNGRKEDFFSKQDDFARQFIEGDIEGPIDIY